MSNIDFKAIEESLTKISNKTPKKQNLVIFIGRTGGSFIDNSKYAFLDCVRHFPQLTCFFLTHDKEQLNLLATKHNLPVLLFPENEAIQICARANVVVSDDFWWRSRSPVKALFTNAYNFQLWHGIPLKKIGFPELESKVNMTQEKAAYLRNNYSGYDAVLSTSSWCTENAFMPSFDAKKFPELGYPRNDVLTRSLDKYDMINVDIQLYADLKKYKKAGWKIVFYLPTFRDRGGDPFSDLVLTPEKMFSFAKKQKTVFVCKFHPYVNCNLKSESQLIRFCDSSHDAYPLLRLADILITDYSSIYFDYLLLNRPILFFLYDHENYISCNRELNFDLNKSTPGPKAFNEEQLFEELAKILHGIDEHETERNELLDKCFAHTKGDSGIRVNNYICSHFTDKKMSFLNSKNR